MSVRAARVALGFILVTVSFGATGQMARWKIDKAAA